MTGVNVCMLCGGDLLELTTLGDPDPVYRCRKGHAYPAVQSHRYSPPLLYMDPRDMLPVKWSFTAACPVATDIQQPRSIYCGPPAPYPPVPTPEDILIGAGLDPGLL